VFAQQSLQPMSRRRYASVSYALQTNTVFSLRTLSWPLVHMRGKPLYFAPVLSFFFFLERPLRGHQTEFNQILPHVRK